ncbi:HFR051Cp [Eremothecium sinecaudum]|uniref:HFR051Cp n=1 Tax=Eremothecium sinecaudum TaxID=45286 RepID=A0A0X8HUT4_9SACH|nr:HFR051Cp [Eremothecium sinecaudum]AMD21906.1 HFR051Cp [Eremothecium sinecaudum]
MPMKQCEVPKTLSPTHKRGPVSKFRNFLFNEIGRFTRRTLSESNMESSELDIDNDLEQIMNMLVLPLALEKFFIFSLFACLDCFMHYFTIMPLRIVYGFFKRDGNHKVSKELKMLLLIFIASLILLRVDTSRVYHRIKGQSAIKLYMLFQVLEMCDKMLSSLGQNLISLVVTTEGSGQHFPKNLGFFVATLMYLLAHAFILMYQTIALNVAVNSYSNSLLTLLLSMQFAELKASVFKRLDKEGLFQLSIADIVERFQLLTFLTIITCRNIVATGKAISQVFPNSWRITSTSSVIVGVLYGPMVIVIGSELLVDWVKHGYVTKFNRIRPRIYSRFLQVLAQDHQNNIREFQLRIGLPVPALVVLFIVLVSPTILQTLNSSSTSSANTAVILTVGFLCLVLAKFVLQALMMKWINASQLLHPQNTNDIYVPGALSSGMGKVDDQLRLKIHSKVFPTSGTDSSDKGKKANMPPSLNEIRIKKDAKHPHSLEQVTRFKMVSKRIW